MFTLKNTILYSHTLSQYTNIQHSISTKKGPAIPIKKIPDSQDIYLHRDLFFKKTNIPADAYICINNQCHSNAVTTITTMPEYPITDTTPMVAKSDALTTNVKKLYLVIHTADCLPVLFYDPTKQAIGIAHAGWRGIASDIIPRTIQTMQSHYSSRPKDIIVYIGPSICPRHYPVQNDVADIFIQKFPKTKNVIQPTDTQKSTQKKYTLDLTQAALVQLVTSGVLEKNIEKSNICTWEQGDLFSSARKQGADRNDTNWSMIGLV